MDKTDRTEKNKKIRPTAPHVALGIALFLIGGELLTVGIAERGEMYASGIAFLVACLLVGAAAPAASAIFGIKNIRSAGTLPHKLAFVLFGTFASAAAVWVALSEATELTDFAERVMHLGTPRWMVFLLFLAFSAFVGARGVRTVKKFALVSFALVGAAVAVLLLMSIPLLERENLSLGGAERLDLGLAARIFVGRFAPLGVALAYFGFESGDGRGESKGAHSLTPLSATLGAVIGGALLILCYFNVTLLLGSELARGEEYPYSAAVGAISAGKLFMRMEALSYATYFLAAALRTSVAVGTVLEFFGRVLLLEKRQPSDEE